MGKPHVASGLKEQSVTTVSITLVPKYFAINLAMGKYIVDYIVSRKSGLLIGLNLHYKITLILDEHPYLVETNHLRLTLYYY